MNNGEKAVSPGVYLSYQIAFILNFIACFYAMKIISWVTTAQSARIGTGKRFFFSPYVSVRSLSAPSPQGFRYQLVVKKLIFFIMATVSLIYFFKFFLAPLSLVEIILFSPVLYLITEALGSFGQALFFFTPTFAIHRSPILATNLSTFWGREWNIWVQDWLRDVSHFMARGKKIKSIGGVFIISGLFHEIMINFPYWLLYGESYFGSMIGYFLIQAGALWIDKKYVKSWPQTSRRIYMWLAIIIPSPLFINVPLLTFFGLSHE